MNCCEMFDDTFKALHRIFTANRIFRHIIDLNFADGVYLGCSVVEHLNLYCDYPSTNLGIIKCIFSCKTCYGEGMSSVSSPLIPNPNQSMI